MPLNYPLTVDQRDKLDTYVALIKKWQKTINLVAPSTLSNIWERHIYDSLGYLRFLGDETSNIVDLGSGGGFPAMVIAICRPDILVSAIESDERKAVFMEVVSRETSLKNFRVYNKRIEDSVDVIEGADVLTARAFAPLSELLSFMSQSQYGLFAKGRSYRSEVEQAQAIYDFEYNANANPENEGSFILQISNVSGIGR